MPAFLRSKRFWKRCAIGIGLLVSVLLIVNAVFAWRVELRLRAKIASIRSAGDPASIADLAPEPIPDDKNAAAVLQRISAQLLAFSIEHGRFFNTPIGKVYAEGRDRGDLPAPDQIAAIRAIVDKFPEIDQGIADASACEQYASLADFTLDSREFMARLMEQHNIRIAARFTGWKMAILVSDGDSESAVERGKQILQLTRLHEFEPGLVSFLVSQGARGNVIEGIYDALDRRPIPTRARLALDEELARYDDPQRLVRALKSEQAISTSITVSSASHIQPAWLGFVVGWPVRSHFVNGLNAYDRPLGLAARPWYEVRKELGVGDSRPPSSGSGALGDLLQPALIAAHQAHARSLTMMRGLRIFNAITQFQEVHGREGSGLADLALPKEATTDPYSGEPLKLNRTEEGWVIYSVLDNGVDNGGDFKGLKDGGLAPPGPRRAN